MADVGSAATPAPVALCVVTTPTRPDQGKGLSAMRVLMLGWEFPPFISGGLGTACYGLTRAMSRMGADVLFVLPKSVDPGHSSHVRLLSPQARLSPRASVNGTANGHSGLNGDVETWNMPGFEHVVFKAIPAWLKSPYQTPADYFKQLQRLKDEGLIDEFGKLTPAALASAQEHSHTPLRGVEAVDYSGDIISEVQRYAEMSVRLVRREQFDVIHAHDWMTFPAGMAIAGMTGKPLVVHVHSTEFDRAGEAIHSTIYDIERRGMHAATRVVCVSHLTRKICEHRYGVPHEKIQVVYNGIETDDRSIEPTATIQRDDKIVLFLGRLTMQKGPEYFLAAAQKVLEKYDHAKFIIAGSGDLAQKTIELAAQMGLGHKVLFTGFLRGKDVERIFQMADVYVMPSVSEPFGIAPLEAIRHDVPVIISKNSGVAEVLSHALKVDFWDINEMANKIIAVLKHPPLSQTLREHADFEVRKLTWEGAASRCLDVYRQAIAEMAAARIHVPRLASVHN